MKPAHTHSEAVWAVVLRRESDDATTARILVGNSEYEEYEHKPGEFRKITNASHLVKAAMQSAANRNTHLHIFDPVLVFDHNPADSGPKAMTSGIDYPLLADLQPLDGTISPHNHEDEQGNVVTKFYVLLNAREPQQIPMQIAAAPAAAVQANHTAVDQLARRFAEHPFMVSSARVTVASDQATSRVHEVIGVLRALSLKDQYDMGEVIELPPLSVRTGQDIRFTRGYVIYRPIFDEVLALATADLDTSTNYFQESTPIYVWGPKGIGKSHALRYTVARLWQLRLNKPANFRVLYLDEYCRANLQSLKYELMLCFHDDPAMLQQIQYLETSESVNPFLSNYVQQPGRRLVIILDQVFDTYASGELGSLEKVFPTNDRAIRVIFASSPKFELQGRYMGGDRRLARPFAFMTRLRNEECASMAVKLLQDMCATMHDQEKVKFLQDLERTIELAVRTDRVQALEAAVSRHDGQPDEETEAPPPPAAQAHDGQPDKKAEAKAAQAIFDQLKETSGNVPLYLREILQEHLLVSMSVPDACNAFNLLKFNAVRENTLSHYETLGHRDAEHLLDFLSLALAHSKLPHLGVTDHFRWKMRDLRYVYLLDDGSIGPLCPACFHGFSSALLEIAVRAEEQDASDLIQKLEAAMGTRALTPTEVGFAQEHIFLAKLTLQKNRHILATQSSAAAPTGMSGRVRFMFNRVLTVDSFAKRRDVTISKYSETRGSVLFIPHQPNEPYVDAVMCDYDLQVIYAFQVTRSAMQEHASSLGFFTEESGDLWKNLIPADDDPDTWTKNFIWVLSSTDTPSHGFPSTPEHTRIRQYQISYTDFVRAGIAERGMADVDTRSQNTGRIGSMTKEQLLAICKSEGIRPVSHYRVQGLRAVVKQHMDMEPTEQELASKAQDEADHQASLEKLRVKRQQAKIAEEETKSQNH